MTKTISMHGQDFEISAPYEEGHTCTAAEAKALNQCRAENIGNNMRKHVKAALAIEDEKAQKKALAEVASKMAEYDKEYVFTLAAAGSRTALSPVEKEARRVARAALVAKLKESGVTLKAYTEEHGEDYVKSKVLEIAEMERVIELAKKNVAEQEERAKAAAAIQV